MTNIKVSLSITLPGSVMFSKQEYFKKLEKPVKTKTGKIVKKDGEPVTKTVLKPDFTKFDTLVLKLGPLNTATKVHVRKCKPAKQVINMSEEAYLYMISNEVPVGFDGNKLAWAFLTPKRRLMWHCNRIAEQLGGVVDTVDILD